MAQGKLVLTAAAIAAVSLSALAATSQAVTFIEGPGDAGQTLATAQATGSTAPTEIDGTLSGINDADLYKLTITVAGSYTFSTNNTFTNAAGTDTELSLYTSTGAGVLVNDDATGFVLTSSITSTLSTGTYYLGVAGSGNDAVNSQNQLIFNTYTGGDSTSVRGPAQGLNPAVFSNFNSTSDFDGSGPYHIVFSAPAVPEPSTWAVVGASAAALAFLRRRRVA